ncbi:MAG: cyanoexosortase C [Phormidesmis sp.]
MTQHKSIQTRAFTLVSTHLFQVLKTRHGQVVFSGLLIGLAYLPAWLGYLIPQALKGKIGWFLILSMLLLSGLEIWSKRQTLKVSTASSEDRILGYLLIVASLVLYPFCRFAIWPQAILWFIVLLGIACSTWGLRIFSQFMIPTFFIGLTVYPRIGLISRGLWDFFVPHQWLEVSMATAGTAAMKMIGFQAEQKGIYITFPEGAVEVGWGCNGLDMAITIAAAALFMGLIYKQKRSQMIGLIVIAASIALVANVPRLMLVSIAHVYWGPKWFDFWHGFWGGQIFSGILFTGYYYVALALIEKETNNNAEPTE